MLFRAQSVQTLLIHRGAAIWLVLLTRCQANAGRCADVLSSIIRFPTKYAVNPIFLRAALREASMRVS